MRSISYRNKFNDEIDVSSIIFVSRLNSIPKDSKYPDSGTIWYVNLLPNFYSKSSIFFPLEEFIPTLKMEEDEYYEKQKQIEDSAKKSFQRLKNAWYQAKNMGVSEFKE